MVLITGFEPFGGRDRNFSADVAREASGRIAHSKVEILPVSFGRVPALVEKTIDTHRPEVLVMLGYAQKRTMVSIERIGINLADALTPDNDGVILTEARIADDGEQAYFANVGVREIATAIQTLGIAAQVSNSAGLYVCNAAYYTALHFIRQKRLNTKALFIHLPEMSLAEATRAVVVAVETIMKQ